MDARYGSELISVSINSFQNRSLYTTCFIQTQVERAGPYTDVLTITEATNTWKPTMQNKEW
jgi:hypothetical protein